MSIDPFTLQLISEVECPGDRAVLETLENEGMTTRAYAKDVDQLEEFVDAINTLYRHIVQLDTQNCTAWNIPLLKLMSMYGAATGQRSKFYVAPVTPVLVEE